LFVVVECIALLKRIIHLANIGPLFSACLPALGEAAEVRTGNFVNFKLKNNTARSHVPGKKSSQAYKTTDNIFEAPQKADHF